eukprot:TRINITY_DN2784_c0_g1_i2.p1 TRINITY_DN2784_c0_g1~~TRINITY_DN2784_c0_g1_i2.p1  ORF type:complete len:177 (-),score=41.30 TRINITY_DN2784_c0_g1_i2:100-630(-)
MAAKVRKATHAGSWYSDQGETLRAQLEKWLDKVGDVDTSVRGIIVPHAGYSYSGPSAAYGYKTITPDSVKRIFVLGPSHHAYLKRCVLSKLDEYETPIGNLKVDKEMNKKLHETGWFDWVDTATEEAEHSLEMHLPYIKYVMGKRDYTIIPIMVGAISKEYEDKYGDILAPYFILF